MSNTSPAAYANAVKNRLYTPMAVTDGNPRKYIAEVAENNTIKDNTVIRVFPKELIPLVTPGKLRDNPISISRKYTDAQGRPQVAKGTHASTIIAFWFNQDGTRTLAPQVQRGEEVLIWQEGTTGKWRWEEINRSAKSIRRQETVINSVNADKPDGPDSEKHDSSNTYYTETSAHNKSYTVSTSKANGEVAAYKFQINGEKGAIVLQDDQGNYIELFTNERRILLKNKDNSYLEIVGNDIHLHCNENAEFKIDGSFNIEVGKDIKMKAGGSINIESGGSTTMKSSSFKCDSPSAHFTGSVKIDKGLNVSGMSTMGGGGTVQGSLAVSGPVKLNGGTSSRVIEGSYR